MINKKKSHLKHKLDKSSICLFEKLITIKDSDNCYYNNILIFYLRKLVLYKLIINQNWRLQCSYIERCLRSTQPNTDYVYGNLAFCMNHNAIKNKLYSPSFGLEW